MNGGGDVEFFKREKKKKRKEKASEKTNPQRMLAHFLLAVLLNS